MQSPKCGRRARTNRLPRIRWFLFLLFALVAAPTARADLPPGWSSQDVGTPALAGSASWSGEEWTLTSGGTNLCGSSEFHYAWRTFNGDGAFIVRVQSMSGGGAYSEAGLLIREGLSAESAQASLMVRSNTSIWFRSRSTSGATCATQASGPKGAFYWLKLQRNGATLSAYYSPDRVVWTQLGTSQFVAMGTRAYVGVAACANLATELSAATLSQFEIESPVFAVLREGWTGLSAGANALATLTNTTLNPNWPSNPDPALTTFLPSWDTEVNTGLTNYGQRLRAFVVPPTDGLYQFGICSSGASELRLSPGETPEAAVPVAWVTAGTFPREWAKEATQSSGLISLRAGCRYYLEARTVHPGGTDHMTVRWRLPDGSLQEPLAAIASGSSQLIPFSGEQQTPPGIYFQPTNTSVAEGGSARFWLLTTNRSVVDYQWQLNGTNLAGATSKTSALILSNLTVGLGAGDALQCVLSNPAGAVTSAPAYLTIIPDSEPPQLVRGLYQEATRVQLLFSEPLDPTSAADITHYTLEGGAQISAAVLHQDGVTVDLITTPMTFAAPYRLTIQGVRDRSYNRNPVPEGTSVSFFAAPYAPVPIGGLNPPGELTGSPDEGVNLTGGGAGIGATADVFQFACQLRVGDFDVCARLKSLSQTDAYAKAGLMAREDLSASGRYAAALATPTIAGAFFSARTAVGARGSTAGQLPVVYPSMWLRLQRQGDVFTGFASYDAQTWQVLGSATIPMTNMPYLGLAVSSQNTNVVALAEFRDIADVTNAIIGKLLLPSEPLGPSSRKTGLAITEVMYHPFERADGRDLEYIEILNTQPFFEDISGYRISGSVDYTFPPATVLPSGAYIVVAAAPADLKAIYGGDGVLGPYQNRLPNSKGTVRLQDRFGAVLLEIQYDSQAPWPVAADGAGHSLVLKRPSYGENDPRAWAISDRKGGSPGQTDAQRADPADDVVINEFLARSGSAGGDFIELFNRNTQEIDLSGCFLSDDRTLNKFRIPENVHIPGRGLMVFHESQLGFALNAAGESIVLVNRANDRVLDAVRFGGQASEISSGRFPEGEGLLVELATPTPGTANAVPLARPVVINEIMYNPISGDTRDEYVELYNKGADAVALAGWRFTGGIDFTFPPNASIAAGGYLVVAKDAAWLKGRYPNLHAGNLVGDFSGALSGRGDRITLSMADRIYTTNATGTIQAESIQIVADDVDYKAGGRWGTWSDGGGSSLELINPGADNRLAPSWADSDETLKAPWTQIEFTGVLDLGMSGYPPDQLQLFLQGAGECLLDNVGVFRPGGTNVLRNGTFDIGAANWTFQGTHRVSSVEQAGGDHGGVLHLRASGRGDTGANRSRGQMYYALSAGETATLRGQVRWLKGNPEILFRLKGNWLEFPKRLELPAHPGTPGARNSSYRENLGPAITDVAHWPILPAVNQSITVTARVTDPQGTDAVELVYRNDTQSGPSITVQMVDDGAGVDARAGDGIYSASIPASGTKTMYAFYIVGRDGSVPLAESRFPNDAPARECLVQTGEATQPGSFGVYRLWVGKNTVAAWSGREKNSNEPLDATFVYGNSRVVYNMTTLYGGSPWHTGSYSSPVGSACDYVLHFPDDEALLGAFDFVIATLGNLNSDSAYQREQTAFWMLREMGVPSMHRRFIFMYVNGLKRGTVMEDAQQPNGDVLDEYFPDDNKGNLHKIEDWFEFDNAGSGFANADATLDNFVTTGGVKKMARYRWCWRPRAVQSSASDFQPLFQLVDALQLGQPEPYTGAVESLMDVDNWMRMFALQRIVGNWDSFSYNRGKNMYAYRPQRGRWMLLPWDIDFVLGLGDGASSGLFGGQDAPTQAMKSFPPFARAYWRAFYDAANGPMLATRIGPMMEAKFAALVANGVSATPPATIATFVSQRRTYLLNQLASVTAPFSLGTPSINGNVAQFTGKAPVQIKDLLFNGKPYPVTWTSVTDWRASVPLAAGLNHFTIEGVDYFGNKVTGALREIMVDNQVQPPPPAGQVVINEIMLNPAVPDAEFVELYNTSPTFSFDLSGWRFDGLSYTFPSGTVLAPNSYLVLGANRLQFAAAFGVGASYFDTFAGRLDRDGETLSLTTGGTNASIVTRVHYEPGAPWPAAPNKSLQLRDPRRDNWRAGNWAAAEPGKPQWQFVTTTGTTSSSLFYLYLETAGDVYIDDLQFVAGTVPETGVNLAANGDFETAFPGPWTVSANHAGSSITTAVKHTGKASLHLVATSGGNTQGNSIWQTLSGFAGGGTYTLSFWYLPGDAKVTVTARVSGSGVRASVAVNPASPSAEPADPGRVNGAGTTLTAFPPLWINELQAENLTGLTTSGGRRAAWVELFNPTPDPITMSGLFLANNYTNLTQWAFPSDLVIKPGEFKLVFADGQSNQTTTLELHAGFELAPGTGSVVLTRVVNDEQQVLDYANYENIRPDHSYGSAPDAQAFDRQQFDFVTPGATNDARRAPIQVVINEWMSDNLTTFMDPADGKFDDWFELYNPSETAADLGGYYLTDSAENKTQFQVPTTGHHVIPPKGFLVVWADNDPGQVSMERPDLHTNFRLDKAGESIGLFDPEGRAVDFVTFGAQQTDRASGRFPDGSTAMGTLPHPTPGAPNAGVNTMPVLRAVPDLYVYVGQSTSLGIEATDEDLPPQDLTFGLGQSAPPNVTLDPASGLFTWAASEALGTNQVTIMVTDSGTPPLRGTVTFHVVVLQPSQLLPVISKSGSLRLSFGTLPGQWYELLSTSDLETGPWRPVSAATMGNGETFEMELPLPANPETFYRLLMSR